MKAFFLDQPGEPETLRLDDAPTPEPGAGEVRVRVEAVALNPVDYKVALRGHPMWVYPFTPGLDVAGVVDAVGSGVSEWKPGDRVYYHGDLRKPGGFAEFAVTDARVLARVPADVTSIQAAALPTAAFTAYQAVFSKAAMRQGATVLVHGGAGGVGSFAVQFAKYAGFKVLTTASPRNNEVVKSLGADHVIDYRGDVKAEVMRVTQNRGVDMVIDTVSPESAKASFDLLAFGGHLVCIAGLPDFSVWKPFQKAASVHEIALGGAHASDDDRSIRDLGRIGEEVIALVSKKILNPMVGEVTPFADLPKALTRLKNREVPAGKVVVSLAGK